MLVRSLVLCAVLNNGFPHLLNSPPLELWQLIWRSESIEHSKDIVAAPLELQRSLRQLRLQVC